LATELIPLIFQYKTFHCLLFIRTELSIKNNGKEKRTTICLVDREESRGCFTKSYLNESPKKHVIPRLIVNSLMKPGEELIVYSSINIIKPSIDQKRGPVLNKIP
jgi:hypothetical protein